MSKLSLHISDWLNPELTFEFIERTRPPVIKVFGDAGLDDMKVARARQLSPATLFVGRMYFPEQGIERDERAPVDTVFSYDPIGDAHKAFEQMRAIIAKMADTIDVWEGYNEIPIDTEAPLTDRERRKAQNYSAFTVEMARLIHQAGRKYAAYSFSTGNPVHLELWDLLLEGLRASDYLALHEYIAPSESWDDFNWSMCNRYRAIYAQLPADARKPIIITECGADYLGQQGYKSRIPTMQYFGMMAEYDRELMRDPIVVGATIYCYGVNAPQWKTYDIGGEFTKLLVQHILSNPTPPVDALPVQPVPTTPPAPTTKLEAIRQAVLDVIQKLNEADSSGAHKILIECLIPWFYSSSTNFSADLSQAKAHTAARWYCEESARKIEGGDLSGARRLLEDKVLAWFDAQAEAKLAKQPRRVKKPALKDAAQATSSRARARPARSKKRTRKRS